jgi:hypothetical protein
MRMPSIGRVIVAALCLFGCSPPAAAKPSEAEFTRQMAERFRAALPGRTVQISAEPLQLRVQVNGEPAEINVGRIFNFCANSSEADCENSIAHFVSATSDTFSKLDAPIARGQLRLVVRASEYCDYVERTIPKDQARPVARPFLPGLCTLLMADFPNNRRTVTGEDLGKLALAPDEAWSLAERQTLADLPTPATLEGLATNVVIVSGFDYATSLMLNSDGWRSAAAAHGDLVAAVPEDSAMIVGRIESVGDLGKFKAAVREHFETAERGVSPIVYRWTASGWKPLD